MAQAIIRPLPIYIGAAKVAEASSSTENRTVNASNQYGIDGVFGQAIGADEIDIDFDTIVPILGMQINVDQLIGVPVTMGVFRNATMMMSQGVIMSSSYKSQSKDGTATGTFKFIGGAPVFAI
jgi:hypothetical protein